MAVPGVNGIFSTGGRPTTRYRGSRRKIHGSSDCVCGGELRWVLAAVWAIVSDIRFLRGCFIIFMCTVNLAPPIHCAVHGVVESSALTPSASARVLNSSATECNSSVIDDKLFERFFDVQCLVDLEHSQIDCPLSGAYEWWQAMSSELRIDSLLLGTLSWTGLASLFLAGGIPDHRAEPEGKYRNLAKCQKWTYLLMWWSVQVSQFLFTILSMISIILGYASMNHHYSSCLQEWVGARMFGGVMQGWKVLHLVTLPTAFLHPLVFMRVAVVALGISAAAISMTVISETGQRFFARAETAMILVIRAIVWIQLFLVVFFCFCNLILVPLPMIIVVQTVVVLTGFGLFRSRMKGPWGPKALQKATLSHLDSCLGRCCCCRCSWSSEWTEGTDEHDEWGMLSWMASEYERSDMCEALRTSCIDLLQGFRKDKNQDLENIAVAVYAILLTSILSPMLIIALWLGIETLGCDSTFGESCSLLYNFVFASALKDMELPDVLAFLQEFPPDLPAAMEWIANMDNYLEFKPAVIMRNARLLTAIQTWLAILKVVMQGGNSCLKALDWTGYGVKTIPIHEILYGEIAKTIIEKDPTAFQRLNPKQRNMTDLAEAAFRKNPGMLVHIGDEALKELIEKRSTLKDVLSKVGKDKNSIRHIHRSYILKAKEGPQALASLDPEDVKHFIRVDALVLKLVGSTHQNDCALVQEAFRRDKESLQWAGKDAVKHLIPLDSTALTYASDALWKDPELMFAAYAAWPSETLEDRDKNEVKTIIEEKDACALRHCTQLKNDIELVRAAYAIDKKSLIHAGQDAVKHIIEDDPNALQYATQEIQWSLTPKLPRAEQIYGTPEKDDADPSALQSATPAEPVSPEEHGNPIRVEVL